MTTDSPYAPPTAELRDISPDADSQAESIRREHVRHEVQLKSVGSLYFLSGGLMLMAGFGTLYFLLMEPSRAGSADSVDPMVAIAAVYLVLGSAVLALGYGFRRLRSWVRIPGGIISGIGLLGIPVGTLINGYILYLMFGARGRVVLAPDYRAIIDATPHIRYRRTVSDWIAVGILALLVVGIAALLLFGMA